MINKSVYIDSPLFMFKKGHKCPNCNNKIITQKTKKIVNSKSIEAKEFNFSCGDSFLCGDVEFTYYLFYCVKCNKEYKINEIKSHEKNIMENNIKNKGGNKIIMNIKLFINKYF